jgi:hypothetical protein
MVPCTRQAHIEAVGCPSSLSKVCRGRQWEQRGERLPVARISISSIAVRPQKVLKTARPFTHHTRAGEGIPAETDTITVLDLTPLVLESFEVGHVDGGCVIEGSWWRDRWRSRYIGGAVWNAGFAGLINLRRSSRYIRMWPLAPRLGYNNCAKLRRFQSSCGQPAWRPWLEWCGQMFLP